MRYATVSVPRLDIGRRHSSPVWVDNTATRIVLQYERAVAGTAVDGSPTITEIFLPAVIDPLVHQVRFASFAQLRQLIMALFQQHIKLAHGFVTLCLRLAGLLYNKSEYTATTAIRDKKANAPILALDSFII